MLHAAPSSTLATPPHVARWGQVVAMLLPAILFQGIFLSCACEFGQLKFHAALAADTLIVLRALVALATRDNSNWWKFYLALYFLVVPITLAFASLAGAH